MLYSYFADRRLYLIKKYRNTKRVFYISTLQIHSSFFTCCQGLSCLRRCTSVLHQSTAKTDSQHQTHKTQIQIQIQINAEIQRYRITSITSITPITLITLITPITSITKKNQGPKLKANHKSHQSHQSHFWSELSHKEPLVNVLGDFDVCN